MNIRLLIAWSIFTAFMPIKSMIDERNLHTACLQALHDLAADLVCNKKVNINEKDTNYNTALHIAIEKDDTKLVQLLLFFGADLRTQNKQRKTPFQLLQPSGKVYTNDYCLKLLHERIAQEHKNENEKPECPVCLEEIKELHSDFFNWECLHFICIGCKKKVSACPTCRSENKSKTCNPTYRDMLYLIE